MDQAGFEWVKDVAEIYDYNKRIYLSHYAMLRWPASHRGSLHLFGHSHGKLLNPAPNSLDVGVDCWDYKPVTLKQILEKLCQN
jgi:calcineurin-like phosphoesterase family protein